MKSILPYGSLPILEYKGEVIKFLNILICFLSNIVFFLSNSKLVFLPNIFIYISMQKVIAESMAIAKLLAEHCGLAGSDLLVKA